MIIQSMLDFFRDLFATWVDGVSSLIPGDVAVAAGEGLGAAAGAVSRVLALFVSPTLWPSVLSMFSTFLVVFFLTALIAIVSRRGASS